MIESEYNREVVPVIRFENAKLERFSASPIIPRRIARITSSYSSTTGSLVFAPLLSARRFADTTNA